MTSKWDIHEELTGKTHEDIMLDHETRLRALEGDDELNPYEQGLHEEIERLEAKLSKAMSALDEAIYMLAPNGRDMEMRAGIYRIITAYEELKGITP